MRFQEVVDNLAAVANNPATLPSIAVPSGGLAFITNTVGVDPTTTFEQATNGFSKQALNLLGRHNPDQQWTVSPVVAAPHIEALHYAFLWMVIGPPPPTSPAMDLLSGPFMGDTKYHFDVARLLAAIPPGWLRVGTHCDVPTNACYKAHCKGTYVWVERSGLPSLSEFTLVVFDIATTDPASLVAEPPIAQVQVGYIGAEGTYTVTETRPAHQVNGRVVVDKRQGQTIFINPGNSPIVTPPNRPQLRAE